MSIWGKNERTSGSDLTYLAVNPDKISTAVALRATCMLAMHNTSVLNLRMTDDKLSDCVIGVSESLV